MRNLDIIELLNKDLFKKIRVKYTVDESYKIMIESIDKRIMMNFVKTVDNYDQFDENIEAFKKNYLIRRMIGMI